MTYFNENTIDTFSGMTSPPDKATEPVFQDFLAIVVFFLQTIA